MWGTLAASSFAIKRARRSSTVTSCGNRTFGATFLDRSRLLKRQARSNECQRASVFGQTRSCPRPFGGGQPPYDAAECSPADQPPRARYREPDASGNNTTRQRPGYFTPPKRIESNLATRFVGGTRKIGG